MATEAGSARKSWFWKTVLLCVLAQNLAGITFGAFGPLLASNEEHFGVSRAMAAGGMSAITLLMAIGAPVLGGFLLRFRVRNLLGVAAAISGAAYIVIALTNSFGVALAMYCLIGIAACVFAILAPVTTVSKWFASDRGKILGIINLPLFSFIAPYVIGLTFAWAGRELILIAIGLVFIVALPFLLMVKDSPEQVGLSPHGAGPSTGQVATHHADADGDEVAIGKKVLLRSPTFWLLSLGIAIMSGTFIAFIVHLVPFGTSLGMSLQTASSLLAVFSLAGFAGILLFGWISDRVGPTVVLAIISLLQAVLWTSILYIDGVALFAAVAILGLCVYPMPTLHGAAIAQLANPKVVSQVMGISYAVKLPFVFGFAPMVGALFAQFGGYDVAFQTISVSLIIAAMFFAGSALLIRSSTLTRQVSA